MEHVITLGNHLWQSTVIAAGIALLGLLLRRSPANARCWLWLAALLKFALPIALLIALGGALAPIRSVASTLQPASYYSLDTISQPLTYAPGGLPDGIKRELNAPRRSSAWTGTGLSVIWAAGFVTVLVWWFMGWRRVATVRRRATLTIDGRLFESLRRVREDARVETEIALLLSEDAFEPGIVGIARPMLLWPRHLSAHLSEAETAAVMAHEVEHVHRRDNLASAIATLVASTFWFCPLVWWLRSRLTDDREAACDEAVVLLGHDPEVYAASILRTCQFCLQTPAICVAGITGSGLKERVRRIVLRGIPDKPPRVMKWALASLGIAVVASPVVFGVVDVPRVTAALIQELPEIANVRFEVASIKPADPASGEHPSLMMSQGRFTTRNEPLLDIIMFAYDAKSISQVSGYPDWVTSSHFDIDAKEDDASMVALAKMPTEARVHQVRLMVQTLLTERFHLEVGRKMKDIPVYALVIARGGPKLTQVEAVSELGGPSPAGKRGHGVGFDMRPGEIRSIHATLDMFASGPLSRMQETEDRVVVNKTGLTGQYDFTLKWTPENPSQATAEAGGTGNTAQPSTQTERDAPGLFTALDEQLGLRLEPQKGSVEVLVVDHVERPSPN